MLELGSVGVNAVRSSIGGVILVVWVLATAGAGAFTAISASAWMFLALSIVVAIALGDTVFFESSRALGLARAMTISTTYPLGAAAIAAVFLRPPLSVPWGPLPPGPAPRARPCGGPPRSCAGRRGPAARPRGHLGWPWDRRAPGRPPGGFRLRRRARRPPRWPRSPRRRSPCRWP